MTENGYIALLERVQLDSAWPEFLKAANMHTIITPEKIELPPGAVLKLLGDWQDYQVLSQQLGDRSFPRIKYRRGEILLMAPLPEHGRDASLLALIVTALLDHLNLGIL